MLGAGLAHHLDLPLAASWHTNVHEYAARRSDWFLRLLPERQSAATGQTIEDMAMATAARFYSVAHVLFAPNPELCGTRAHHRPPLPSDAARRRRRTLSSREAQALGDERTRVLGLLAGFRREERRRSCKCSRSSSRWVAISASSSLATAETKLAARAVASGRVYRRAARGGAGRRLRQHGPLRLSLAHRHVRQRGA